MSTKSKSLLAYGIVVLCIVISLSYAFQAFNSQTVFQIKGDVVDEDGKPLDTGLGVGEGQFVSITQESDQTHFESTPSGKFDVKTVPCNIVSLYFSRKGYLPEHVDYGDMSQVPNPLHIVMHKKIPSTAAVEGPANVCAKYLAQGEYMPPVVPYQSMELDLKPDFTLETNMKLPDGKTKYKGTGTWTRRDRDNVLLDIKWENGAPVPSRHPSKGDRLTIMDPDGRRLLQDEGGPDFFRDPSSPVAPAPANLVGKYVAYGQYQYLPAYPYFSMELNLNSDFTLSTVTTMPDQKIKYKGEGTWTRSGPYLIEMTIKQEKDAPILPGHPANTDRLSIMDGGQRLLSSYGGPKFYRIR